MKKYRIIYKEWSHTYFVQRQILNWWLTVVGYPELIQARRYILSKGDPKDRRNKFKVIEEIII